MSYIYDILLNFNKNLIEYFEWEDTDKIKYIKKILLFKTSKQTVKDIIENEVLLDSAFTSNIPKYEINDLKEEKKICLITDGEIVIGLLIDNNKVECISRLLLDEEYEAILASDNLVVTNVNYKILKPRDKNNTTLTRNEIKIKKQLLEEIDFLYKNKKYDKLIYLYYEYTGKENKDIEYIYSFLKNSFKCFNNNHLYIYKILSMSNVKAE